MKYLVTGGAGFIGSNIVKRLLSYGEYVRVVDNFSTGKMENIERYKDEIDLIIGDLNDLDVARKAVRGIDVIFHEAAVPSVVKSIENPIETNNSTVSTTVNLFTACVKEQNIKRIIQATSSAAYGDTKILPAKEDINPNPLSPYAVAKLTQEYYGKAFFNSFGIEIISLRYFNVFGPNQDTKSLYSAVIPIFVSKILNDENPIIFGSGEISRDFTYVDNVIDANILASKCKWPGNSEVINIGAGERISLDYLVNEINNILGKSIKPIYTDRRVGDIEHSYADITKAKEMLTYTPNVSFEEGLAKFINWYLSKIRC